MASMDSSSMQDAGPPVQSTEFATLLAVSPPTLTVPVTLHEEIFVDMTLTNLSDSLLAFKVKTTARDRYLLKPTQDYIGPHSQCVCKIVVSAMSHYPDPTNPKAVRDKFLVQSVTMAHEVDDLSAFWREREAKHSVKSGRYAYHELRVKCKLLVPGSQSVSVVDEDDTLSVSTHTGTSTGQQVLPMPGNATFTTQIETPSGSARTITNSITSAPNSAQKSFDSHTSPVPSQPPNVPVFNRDHSRQSSASTTSTAPNDGDSRRLPPRPATIGASSPPPVSEGDEKLKRDHSELMDFVVRLTAQMEREKHDAAIVNDKYHKALHQINVMQKKIQQLQQQQQTQQSSESVAPVVVAAASVSAKPGDESQSLPVTTAVKDGSEALKVRGRLMSDSVRNNSGGLNWQFYQLILIAIIAFVAGRIFAR